MITGLKTLRLRYDSETHASNTDMADADSINVTIPTIAISLSIYIIYLPEEIGISGEYSHI